MVSLYIIKSKIKAWYCVLPWHLVKLAYLQALLPTLLPWIRSSSQTNLIKGISIVSVYPWVMSFCSLTAIQRSQPHPPLGIRGHPTVLTLENLPSTATTLFQIITPMRPKVVSYSLHRRLWIYVLICYGSQVGVMSLANLIIQRRIPFSLRVKTFNVCI